MFCYGGKNMNSQPVGCRHVTGDELNPRFHQVGYEGDVSGQTIQLGDQQGGAMDPAEGQCLQQPRPVILPPAFHFLDLSNKLSPHPAYKLADSHPLRPQPEP
ncbi:hypothetical protein FBZ90_102450 [Nitrospirillum pindoramense]|uniref:Uncharacterized protein n=1 Tax=Nitrospirillum amazonense TaxID=28077 RepID=A0A560HGC1_9PROT|nr:hypothetical protein FBZ90_102450 [Nitrospirillum amazonense]